jgi:zinc-ribbon domain
MEISCEECHAVIQIPEDRVPRGSAFRLTCPRCKRKILAGPKISEGSEKGAVLLIQSRSLSEVSPLANQASDDDPPQLLDSSHPGQIVALLCVNRQESRDELRAILEGMAYVVDIPATVDHALERLRFNQYQAILLDDDFGGKSPNPVAVYLSWLDMNARREMLIVLIGQRLKTADHLQAFMESVDLTLHPDDQHRVAAFLRQGMRDHERFYRVFTECLIEAGKKI